MQKYIISYKIVKYINSNNLDLAVQLVCPDFPNKVSNNPRSLDCTSNSVFIICQACRKGED